MKHSPLDSNTIKLKYVLPPRRRVSVLGALASTGGQLCVFGESPGEGAQSRWSASRQTSGESMAKKYLGGGGVYELELGALYKVISTF